MVVPAFGCSRDGIQPPESILFCRRGQAPILPLRRDDPAGMAAFFDVLPPGVLDRRSGAWAGIQPAVWGDPLLLLQRPLPGLHPRVADGEPGRGAREGCLIIPPLQQARGDDAPIPGARTGGGVWRRPGAFGSRRRSLPLGSIRVCSPPPGYPVLARWRPPAGRGEGGEHSTGNCSAPRRRPLCDGPGRRISSRQSSYHPGRRVWRHHLQISASCRMSEVRAAMPVRSAPVRYASCSANRKASSPR